MSTNLEKRGGRPAKLNAKKSDRELERHKKEGHSLLEGQHEKFVAAVRKREILAATKVKMSRSEKKKRTRTRTTFPL